MTILTLSASADASVFYKKESIFPKYVCLALPALTYLFVLAHIAADKIPLGYVKPAAAFFYPAIGLLLGVATVFLNAGIFYLFSLIKKEHTADITGFIRGLSMSYGISCLMALFGLLLKLVTGWPVIVFGIVAILFSLCPLSVFSVRFFKNKPLIAYTVPVICGLIQILLCNIFITLQF